MTDKKREYPLWCIDRGEDACACRYLGPFLSQSEAPHVPASDFKWRRCRRIRASEIEDLRYSLYDATFYADSASVASVNSAAWYDTSSSIFDSGDNAIFLKAVSKFLDDNIFVDAYICEGDE